MTPKEVTEAYEKIGASGTIVHGSQHYDFSKNGPPIMGRQPPPKYLFLDESPSGQEPSNFVIQHLSRVMAKEKMANCSILQVGGMTTPQAVEQLKAGKWDAVIWSSVCGIPLVPYINIFKVPMINLWFDEPISRVGSLGPKGFEIIERFYRADGVLPLVWDNHWRERMRYHWGMQGGIIHLAAEPDDFYCTATKLSDDIVMIGAMQSPAQMQAYKEQWPTLAQKLATICTDKIAEMVRGEVLRLPCGENLLQMAVAEVGNEDAFFWQRLLDQDPPWFYQFHNYIWAALKNAHRIRILKIAMQVGPVRIMAETKQLAHASTDEIRGMLGEWSSRRLLIADSSDVPTRRLGDLYHYGKLHIGATDPQSVEGGLPLRVFETAASGRALLTDKLDHLRECFEADDEVLTYFGPQDFGEALAKHYARPAVELEAIGRAARKRLEDCHTWLHRAKEIKQRIDDKLDMLDMFTSLEDVFKKKKEK